LEGVTIGDVNYPRRPEQERAEFLQDLKQAGAINSNYSDPLASRDKETTE